MTTSKKRLTVLEQLAYETKELLDKLANTELDFTDDRIARLKGNLKNINLILFDRESNKDSFPDKLNLDFLNVLIDISYKFPKNSMVDVESALMLYGFSFRELNKITVVSRSGIVNIKLPKITMADASAILNMLVPFKKIGLNLANARLYYYDYSLGIYSNNSRVFHSLILHLDRRCSKKERNEIVDWLDAHSQIPTVIPCSDPNLVVLANGIFDVKSKRLYPYSPNKIFLTRCDVNWNPNATHPNFENGWNLNDFFNIQAKSEDDVKMFWQTIQYTLLTNMPKNVFVFLYDAMGNTGKGTFSRLLTNLIGEDNVGTANIPVLSEKFGLDDVYNKSLIYGDENDNVYISLNHNMKSMATGDKISVEGKGEKRFQIAVTPMILQSMNSTPIFKKLDGGTLRRLRMIEFTHSYSGNVNLDVKYKYIASVELLEWVAFTALSMPVEEFSDSVNSQIIKGEMEDESNPVHAFLLETLPDFKGEKMPTNLLFLYFIVWLKLQNKRTDWTTVRFMKELKIEIVKLGWSCPENKQRVFSYIDERDYQLMYDDYLQLGGNSNGIPIMLPYDNLATIKSLKRNGRYIQKNLV